MNFLDTRVGLRVIIVKSHATGVITQVQFDSFSVQWDDDLEYWYGRDQAKVMEIDTSGEQVQIV